MTRRVRFCFLCSGQKLRSCPRGVKKTGSSLARVCGDWRREGPRPQGELTAGCLRTFVRGVISGLCPGTRWVTSGMCPGTPESPPGPPFPQDRPSPGPPFPWTALQLDRPSPGPPKISLFFPSSAEKFVLFFPLWGLLVEFWWSFYKPGPSNVHVWALGLWCETRRLRLGLGAVCGGYRSSSRVLEPP